MLLEKAVKFNINCSLSIIFSHTSRWIHNNVVKLENEIDCLRYKDMKMFYMNEKLVLRSVVAMLVFSRFSYTCCLAIHAAAVERFLSPLCLNKYPIL